MAITVKKADEIMPAKSQAYKFFSPVEMIDPVTGEKHTINKHVETNTLERLQAELADIQAKIDAINAFKE